MMKLTNLLFIPLFLLFSLSGFGQTTIAEQDFDGSTSWSFSSDVTFFSHDSNSGINEYPDPVGWTSDGFYGEINLSDTNNEFSSTDFSSKIIGASDLDDEGDFGASEATLTFGQQSVTGFNNVEISFNYETVSFNSTDELEYRLTEDGVVGTFVALPKNVSGTETINVNATNNLEFEIRITQNGQSDYVGLDNILLTGTPANESDSDIISSSSFDPTDNIDYTSYTATNTLTTTNAIKIGEFDIRDGGSTTDSDGVGTILTDIDFDVTNFNNLAAIALFDGSTNVSEVTSVTATTSFTSINSGNGLTASDDGSKTFDVYATFQTSVTDNEQIQLTVSSATADVVNGSVFNTNDAGGAITPATGDDNRIEVTATDLNFTVQPSTTTTNTAMNPAVEIAAQDPNSNTDKDFNNNISVTTIGSFDASSTTSVSPVDGVAVFSNLIFDSTGSGLTIDGSATGVTATGNSNTFDVDDLDVNFDDFDDGDFTNNPTWTGSTTGFSVISDGTVPNGNASTDGSFLASDASEGEISLAAPSNEVSEWQFSLASPDFNPASTNFIGVVLMANTSFSGDIESNDFQGYYLRIGKNLTDDSIELWRKTGSGETQVGVFPSAPTLDPGALKDGLNLRVTRSSSGVFELFYSTGFQYNAIPTTSAGTLTNNDYDTSSYFGVFQNINTASVDRRVYIDNISLGDSSIDSNTLVSTPTSQVAAGTLTADVATSVTNSVEMFRFSVEDQGTSDGLATEISQFRLVPGSNNTADWSETIQGVRVVADIANGLVAQSDQNVTVNDNEIIIDITATPDDEMTVADGSSIDYTISVFLNQSNINENDVIQLAIPETPLDWSTETTNSSGFNPFFNGFEGNNFTINVNGTGLEFVTEPSTTVINEAMNTVEVTDTDTNGNIDVDFSSNISISSSGTLTNDPVNVTAVNGVATFSGLTHTALGTGLTLTATASGVSDATSAAFDIINQPELLISEVADPRDDPSARYIELYNTGNETIDFSTTNFYLHNATVNNSVQLTDSLPAKSYYIIANSLSTFNSTYGFDADLESQNIVAGNGNDAYYLSTGNTETSLFDIYGVISETQTSPVSWDYEDSRAIRDIPTVVNLPNSTYTSTEWSVATADAIDMTPGVNEQDYIYTDDTDSWTSEGLGSDPDGVSATDKNILVKSGTATLNNTTSVNRIIVSTGATLIIEDLLTIDGDIISEGTTIFRSTATKTAALDQVPTNTRVRGSGFQIERYVPSTSRSFRYISPSVNTAPGTINDNWQEGATSATDDPNPGYGTHITGSSTGANGLDQTSTGNNSLFQWNEGTQAWDAINSTNQTADNLVAGDAYAMLIRGDRSTSLNSNSALGPATTLRATGTIATGDVEIGVDVGELGQNQDDFSLVGNPYQAQIDLELLLKNHNTDLSGQFAYIYDPHITSNGGYATIDLGTGSADGITSTTPNTGTTAANRFLQPNQAFFVETTAASPTPSLTFTESIKSTQTTNVDTFSDDDLSDDQFISINLYDDDEQDLKDGVRVKFSSDYSNQVNNADAPKLWNDLEWFSLVNNANYMAIESRAIPQQDETVDLYTGNYQSTNYHFEIDIHEMDYAEVQLYDAYQDTYTNLSSGVNSVAFSVDASIPESVAGDRFQLVFDEVTFSIDEEEVTSLQVYPNPVTNSRLHITGLLEFSSDSEVQLQLYDILGQEVYQESITTFKQDQEIKLPDLSAGNYLLQLTSGQQTQNTHLLVK